MNGETAGEGGRVVTSQPGTSSYLRTGSTPTSYSSSPRLRRLDDMKKSYLGGGTGGSTTSSTGSYNSTFTSKFTTSSGGYRLASLDRLAQRQKLYEANGVAGEPNPNGNANNVPAGGMHVGQGGGRDVRDSVREAPAPPATTAAPVTQNSTPLVSPTCLVVVMRIVTARRTLSV